MSKTNIKEKNVRLALLGVFSAIVLIMSFVPNLGFISYGAISITLIHIPVFIGAILLGAKDGAILGGVWGIATILRAIVAPPSPIEGSIFWNPLISLLPRILAGIVVGAVFYLLLEGSKRSKIIAGFSAVISFVFTGFSVYMAVGFVAEKSWWALAAMVVVALLFLAIGSGAVYILFTKKTSDRLSATVASILGTVTNTVLVMGAIYIFYAAKFGQELGIGVVNFGGFLKYIMAAFTVNAVLEIVVAVLIATPISLALRKAQKNM